MKNASIIFTGLIFSMLISLPALAISTQQMEKKAREFADVKTKQEVLNIAKEIGADVDSVSVKLEQRGKIIKLSGSVPGSNDLIRILLAVDVVGPFKTIRNYIKVESSGITDGLVMRPVHYEFVPPPQGTEISEEDKECVQLCEEYNQLIKKIQNYVLRKYDERSNVYQPSAKKLISRLSEIQDRLDASLCFKPVDSNFNGHVHPAKNQQKNSK